MAGENGSTTGTVIEQLQKDASSFAFFQAVYLLESIFKDTPKLGHQGPSEKEILKLRPHATLGFPVADIYSIDKIEDGFYEKYLLTTTFMGLYGTDSPLPAFYTEDILSNERDENFRVRDFLDLFHHRLLSLLYRCWSKYRYHIQYEPDAKDPFSSYIFSLCGLRDSRHINNDKIEYTRLLGLTGLLLQIPRSSEGLQRFISCYFDGLKVNVEQGVGQWVSISKEQHSAIGCDNCSLGEDLFLGEYVFSRSSKINLHIGPLKYDSYVTFLPGTKNYSTIEGLVKLYLFDKLDFGINIILEKEERPLLTLSSNNPVRLGFSSWLGSTTN